MTILLTGTHLTPAIATIQALRKKAPEAKLVYVGRKHTGAAESVEKEEIERVGAEFRQMTFGKLHRHFTWRQILELVKFPAGFWQAGKLVSELKPEAVVSFGGYVALPLVIWGKLTGAKLVVHEQTTGWGLANRIAKRLADVAAVSWEEMAGQGVVWTGNPIREEIVSAFLQRRDSGIESVSSLPSSSPPGQFLYITGGNQGAKAIDGVVEKILPDLAEKFEAVSVSRAGANTVTELMYLGIPAILVPLPDSAGGEQQKNARILEETGLGKIINQERLTGESLLAVIKELTGKSINYFAEAKKSARAMVEPAAADRLAEIILREGLEGTEGEERKYDK
ncbi:MAG: UDP-diphospho-muramoylpentapeptide beta-N- acetylglucosaminyltransferase [Candidatus Woesebacteria bacterium GW2011_GWA2_44_33]|uniref:UDP-diphospho-muramoylpentapeptide beta-N-acetylglucosaminyltransferase n=1 Tax=Candidatus Woesebacteria bacterium GW2011_GWA2_44_33 TaxID=1618564 RepID=A0A0G1L9Y0_9BACT|nr:MAG: UDP-diphospho-muramoylpentapeptide beta-N- acetylglucosaminyltransferase [Candidatus Woesebacteria bacterium GW2011_GWA2_44_33]